MDKTDILIFDVEMGQSIFVYPHSNPEYGMLIDCGNTQEFEPIDFLIKKGYVSDTLHNLALTNYDQDHFSGIPHIRGKVNIRTINFAKNLSSSEIKQMKEDTTEALNHICEIKDKYTSEAINYNPPYDRKFFHLDKEHLETPDTNNLSQIVFIEHNGTVVCVSGDLEEKGWKTILEKQPEIKNWLSKTNIFIASHHGRDNGYCSDVFNYCKPECIIISDKGIVHDTQKDMASVYGNHIQGDGIIFNGDLVNKKKVLTTRNSGHLYLQLLPMGTRNYSNFSHE